MTKNDGRGWLALRVVIGVAIAVVLGIALVSAPPTFTGLPSHAGATIWVTAFAAIGTLAAVWAALQAARDSASETRRIQHEAQVNEARIRGEARDREKDLRHMAEQREDRIRHDNVRPILNIDSASWVPSPSDGGGTLQVTIRHDGGQAALEAHMVVVVDDAPAVPLQSSWGRTIVPDGVATLRGLTDGARGLSNEIPPILFTKPHPFRGKSDLRHAGSTCVLELYVMDTLDWWWRQITVPFTPTADASQDSEGGYTLTLAFCFPKHIERPPYTAQG